MTRHNLALFVWTAYLRASVRMWAVRFVRSTPWHPSYANVIEEQIILGWPRTTIDACERYGLSVERVASFARQFKIS